MKHGLERLNQLPLIDAEEALTHCCGASRWVEQLIDQRPFASVEALREASTAAFATLAEYDWLEAFEHHPQIGDLESLKKKFAATARWAGNEQAGANGAGEETLRALAAGNAAYAEKFGFIFIVCATGKSAAEMLALLQARLPHSREEELKIAAGEQEKITALRLDKLLTESHS